ncbi:hypothetical protein [Promicromonospora panici]|uniref:hypothetical protein n=1 Tax=Promicromonospora panici TaxID=2219658 RepID=UPI00101D695A|nr:hypothetical protein [Promicromonospora panici]
MSTLPGRDSWRDAGLEPSEDAEVDTRHEPDEYVPPPEVDPTHEPDEYVPDTPRPDTDGSANEADVVEQALDVPVQEDEESGPEAVGGTG